MNIIRNKLAGLDEVLPLLVFWEMIYLLVGEAIIWILLPVDKPYIGLGFLIGVGLASLSSILTAFVMKKVFSPKKRTTGIMVLALVGRLAIAGAVVALALYTNLTSAVAILIGMLSMQLGVYFEPRARRKREEKRIAEAKANGTYQPPKYNDLDEEDRKAAEAAALEESGDTAGESRPKVVKIRTASDLKERKLPEGLVKEAEDIEEAFEASEKNTLDAQAKK